MDPNSAPETGDEALAAPASGKHQRFNPWLFFGILALPGIISIIVLAIDSRNYGQSAFLTLIIGSVIAGLICGIHFTLAQRSMATGLKVVIGIVSVIGCAGASFALGMGGCYLIAAVMGAIQ